jgi:hypothetical protein
MCVCFKFPQPPPHLRLIPSATPLTTAQTLTRQGRRGSLRQEWPIQVPQPPKPPNNEASSHVFHAQTTRHWRPRKQQGACKHTWLVAASIFCTFLASRARTNRWPGRGGWMASKGVLYIDRQLLQKASENTKSLLSQQAPSTPTNNQHEQGGIKNCQRSPLYPPNPRPQHSTSSRSSLFFQDAYVTDLSALRGSHCDPSPPRHCRSHHRPRHLTNLRRPAASTNSYLVCCF